MNKALHCFYLFALNRLSEAQRIANCSLPAISLLIPLVFITNVAFAFEATPAVKVWGWKKGWGAPTWDVRGRCPDDYEFVTTNEYGCAPFDEQCHPYVGVPGYSPFSGAENCTVYTSDGRLAHGPLGPWLTCSNGGTLSNGQCIGNGGDKGPPPNGSCAGNSINTANGNKFQADIDYPSSGASTLKFSRAYNSLDGLWRHSYSTHLRIIDASIALVMAHGYESFFTVNDSAVTASPVELGRLVKAADDWVYIAENNERFTFDVAGRLTQWTDTSGAKHLLTYESGKVTVTDQLGNTLSFTEDANRQPLNLTVGELQISYTYNASKRLIELTRVRGGQTEKRKFHYEDALSPRLLTGITDERGVRYATWSYDDQGRAISSEHADGAEKVLIAYNADGSSTVTNELGKKTTYHFQTIEGVKRITAIEGEPSANCPNTNSTFTYDDRGLLKTKTDNKGHLTTYDYNERGLEVSRTEAAGTAQARTVTTDWHPTLFLPVTVTEPSRITHYTYDDQGRQLSQFQTDR